MEDTLALLKNFTDASGNVFEPAYWRTVQINIGSADRNINLVLYAYKNADAFNGGKQALLGAAKQYIITGDEFLAVASEEPVGGSLYDVLAHSAEKYALGKKDVDSGEVDEDGKPVMVSFFKDAQQV